MNAKFRSIRELKKNGRQFFYWIFFCLSVVVTNKKSPSHFSPHNHKIVQSKLWHFDKWLRTSSDSLIDPFSLICPLNLKVFIISRISPKESIPTAQYKFLLNLIVRDHKRYIFQSLFLRNSCLKGIFFTKYTVLKQWKNSAIAYTVLPPNSRFLGPGFFREFEIREFKIHNFPPNSLRNIS